MKASTLILNYQRKEVKIYVCGAETVSLVDGTTPFYRYDYQSGGGSESPIDVSTFFSVDSTDCPITTYIIEEELTPGSFTTYGSAVSVSGSNMLVISTASPLIASLYVKASTASGKFERKPISIYICGQETVSVPDASLVSYQLAFNTGTLVAEADVKTWF